jgi:hypothetical protein
MGTARQARKSSRAHWAMERTPRGGSRAFW